MSNLEPSRWTLTVEFDPAAEIAADPGNETVLGWAADFYAYLLRYWGEESEEVISWKDDTLVIAVDVLDYINEPLGWLLSNVIPKRVELVRNEPRLCGISLIGEERNMDIKACMLKKQLRDLPDAELSRLLKEEFAWIFGIIALAMALLLFAAAATGGPIQDVFSGVFAASAGFVVLSLVSMVMKMEVTFSGTDAEWEAEQERTVCRKQPSPHSSARCEMPKGHDPDGPFLADLPAEEMRRAAFHAGRTRGGYWKFWPAEKT